MCNHTGPCPFGNPECEGISGLYFGLLSCWPYFAIASEGAVAVQAGEAL